MKNLILREILWFFVALALSVPLALLFLYFLTLTSKGPTLNGVEKVFTFQLFLVGCLVGFLCVYVVRIIVIGLKRLLGDAVESGSRP